MRSPLAASNKLYTTDAEPGGWQYLTGAVHDQVMALSPVAAPPLVYGWHGGEA